MYTRCFERESKEGYEVVNISEYGFEWYIDNRVVRTGLVVNIESDVESLIEAGFEEVL